jgi:hypothetical protein
MWPPNDTDRHIRVRSLLGKTDCVTQAVAALLERRSLPRNGMNSGTSFHPNDALSFLSVRRTVPEA